MWYENKKQVNVLTTPQTLPIEFVYQPYQPANKVTASGKPSERALARLRETDGVPVLRQQTGGTVAKLSPEDNARLKGEGEPLKLEELQGYFKGDK